jgi:diguanylate cyclase (GGDEF)-like protein
LRIATNGAEALDLVRSDTPDIILLDIVMPEMDGYEVCRRLKENDLTRHIPVIFVTGKTHEEDEFRGLELGAVDYITKPFSLPIVKARVKNHLELKRRGDLLEELAFLDGLTCIHNRRRFDEVLDEEWRRALRDGTWLTVMIIDIDFFKLFNDFYGHAAGDECLKQVGQALKRSFSRASDFVARYGGEEFAAVLGGTRLDGAIECAQKLRDELASMDLKHARSPISDRVTVSIGTASVQPCAESSATELVKIADEMLYRAKREGRDRVKSWPQEGAYSSCP